MVTYDAGSLPYREFDDAVGPSEIAGGVLTETRRGKNARHGLAGQFRQSVLGRLGGDNDVNHADRPGLDPVTRWIVNRPIHQARELIDFHIASMIERNLCKSVCAPELRLRS